MIWFFLSVALYLMVTHVGFRRAMFWLTGTAATLVVACLLIGGFFYGGFS